MSLSPGPVNASEAPAPSLTSLPLSFCHCHCHCCHCHCHPTSPLTDLILSPPSFLRAVSHPASLRRASGREEREHAKQGEPLPISTLAAAQREAFSQAFRHSGLVCRLPASLSRSFLLLSIVVDVAFLAPESRPLTSPYPPLSSLLRLIFARFSSFSAVFASIPATFARFVPVARQRSCRRRQR